MRYCLNSAPQRFPRHDGQTFGQCLRADGKVKLAPQTRHLLVTVSVCRSFARQAWQVSGQCCVFPGRVKTFPQFLHVLVIISDCARSLKLSFFHMFRLPFFLYNSGSS